MPLLSPGEGSGRSFQPQGERKLSCKHLVVCWTKVWAVSEASSGWELGREEQGCEVRGVSCPGCGWGLLVDAGFAGLALGQKAEESQSGQRGEAKGGRSWWWPLAISVCTWGGGSPMRCVAHENWGGRCACLGALKGSR